MQARIRKSQVTSRGKTLQRKQQLVPFASRGFGETVQLAPELEGSDRQSGRDSSDDAYLLTKHIETTPGGGIILQRRLTIRQPGDKYEQ